jgi:thymidylate synthase (FAD)
MVQILKNAGKFVVLTPSAELLEQLLMIEKAGRTCYQSEKGPITEDTAAKFVERLIRSGHTSVLEHSLMVVKFFDVSRGFTHEMVRHRHTGFSQESTRYVDYAHRGEGPDLDEFEIRFVVPPHRDENERLVTADGREFTPAQMAAEYEMFYQALRKAGWVPQDARQFLPIGIKSEIVVSTSFREWRAIFELRTAKAAHWEIRGVMCELLKYVRAIIPGAFDDFVYSGTDQNGVPYFELAFS